MANVLIALGSNCRPEVYMTWAAQRLTALMADVRCSRRIWTHDIKGSGVMYLNQLVTGTTKLTAKELETALKSIEKEGHRSKEQVTIDLDLMQYEGMRYHEKDWPRPYIQLLINDIK